MKAVLFDLDGVLVESIDVWLSAFNETLKEFGRATITKEEFLKRHWGKSTVENFRELGLGRQAVEKCWQKYLQKLSEIKVFPATHKVLEEIRKKYKVALVTNTPREGVVRLLRTAGIENMFDVVTTGDDVKEGKPSPEIVYLACEKLGIKPSEAVLVGDTMADVLAGKAAGCKVVGVKIHADYTVSDISELTKVLEKIENAS